MELFKNKIALLISIGIAGWLVYWVLNSISIENKHHYLPQIFLGTPVDFNKEIRPIINKKCITCHGGVKKSGEFSLLFEEEALAVNKSGKRAIVPGSPGKSEMIRRVKHHDPEQRMPQEDEPLSKEEIALLTRWINQGAPWKDHWAFIPPEEKTVPEIHSDWVQNDIDRFILQKLQEKGLQPNPQADKYTLLRRVSLDLTGLPPTLEEVQQFIGDSTSGAYEKVVDRLLESPAFGERWASMWMDMARYADSKGYEADRPRVIWKYRDWLITAFNKDMPYDQFITEQLAGDLLPQPTDDQLIATAFHRNTMNNDEGGTDNEEFRVAALIDRVSTTWSVLQGTTMECVQCHSHPYDPIRHEDFYRFMSFFNQTADADIPSESPVLVHFTEEKDQQNLTKIKEWVEKFTTSPGKTHEVDYYENLIRITEPKIHPHSFEQIENNIPIKGTSTFKVTDSIYSRTKDVPFNGENRMLIKYRADASIGIMELRLDHKEGDLIGRWPVNQKTKTVYNKEENEKNQVTIFQTASIPIQPLEGRRDLYLVLQGTEESSNTCIIEWILFYNALPGKDSKGYEQVENDFLELFNQESRKVTTPIMLELKDGYQRKTHVFERGNWMVHGEEVEPGVPEKWNPLPHENEENRLGLANWLVDYENPLTARVIINRLWEQLFGIGIVETMEDFGSQGFEPSHPELLDWLALEFMHNKQWRIKKQLKQMVMSATYRQSSHTREDIREMDPKNRLLARGPRVRLTAEQTRDQALAVSGLLSDKMYGESVMPVQPEGIWQVVYSGGFKWETSQGEDRYRRALYTFWRRTSPYPSFIAFDAPSREFCLPRRIDTNTPLQALVTLNDPVYLDIAQALARRVMDTGVKEAELQIKTMYSMSMLRGITPEKLEDLKLLYAQTAEYFNHKPDEICQLTGEEDKELAVLMVLANSLLNLDEFLTKS